MVKFRSSGKNSLCSKKIFLGVNRSYRGQFLNLVTWHFSAYAIWIMYSLMGESRVILTALFLKDNVKNGNNHNVFYTAYCNLMDRVTKICCIIIIIIYSTHNIFIQSIRGVKTENLSNNMEKYSSWKVIVKLNMGPLIQVKTTWRSFADFFPSVQAMNLVISVLVNWSADSTSLLLIIGASLYV